MNGDDFESRLRVLRLLADVVTVPHTLDKGLAEITSMTCQLMGTRQTVILLRDEERHELIVRSAVGIDDPSVRKGHPIRLPDRLTDILWRLRFLHQLRWIEADIPGIGFPILVVPIHVKGARVGVLLTGRAAESLERFDRIQRQLFAMIAAFASLVIENAKVYDYLRQRFAMQSAELLEENRRDAKDRDETEQLMISALANPTKVVRLLAESFYKELVRAGFGPDHITTAAAQILDCITHSDPGSW